MESVTNANAGLSQIAAENSAAITDVSRAMKRSQRVLRIKLNKWSTVRVRSRSLVEKSMGYQKNRGKPNPYWNLHLKR
ncbi:hypothetical protein [Peribacillus frigoritolerans]|uniref:hypothetical protein n=1 Tax=Peribacillus frigoritolerans TaxID=450367 RepID=UPI000FD7429D|nr:hypothetical protein [Peribacillus frigoritolerans]